MRWALLVTATTALLYISYYLYPFSPGGPSAFRHGMQKERALHDAGETLRAEPEIDGDLVAFEIQPSSFSETLTGGRLTTIPDDLSLRLLRQIETGTIEDLEKVLPELLEKAEIRHRFAIERRLVDKFGAQLSPLLEPYLNEANHPLPTLTRAMQLTLKVGTAESLLLVIQKLDSGSPQFQRAILMTVARMPAGDLNGEEIDPLFSRVQEFFIAEDFSEASFAAMTALLPYAKTEEQQLWLQSGVDLLRRPLDEPSRKQLKELLAQQAKTEKQIGELLKLEIAKLAAGTALQQELQALLETPSDVD